MNWICSSSGSLEEVHHQALREDWRGPKTTETGLKGVSLAVGYFTSLSSKGRLMLATTCQFMDTAILSPLPSSPFPSPSSFLWVLRGWGKQLTDKLTTLYLTSQNSCIMHYVYACEQNEYLVYILLQKKKIQQLPNIMHLATMLSLLWIS